MQEALFGEDEAQEVLTPMTVEQARERLLTDTGLRATVTEGETLPLYDGDCRVRVFRTIKDADAYLKRRCTALSELGFVQKNGTYARGMIVYTHRDGRTAAICREKRPAKKKEAPK